MILLIPLGLNKLRAHDQVPLLSVQWPMMKGNLLYLRSHMQSLCCSQCEPGTIFYLVISRCNSNKNGDSPNYSHVCICGTKTGPLGSDQRGNMVLTTELGIKSQPLQSAYPWPGFSTMAISSLRSYCSNQSYNSQGHVRETWRKLSGGRGAT